MPVKNIHELFQTIQHTWKTLKIDRYYGKVPILKCFRNALNDPSISVIKSIVDGKVIYAHKTILQLRCQHFQRMLGSEWKEHESGEVQINHSSYEVYKTFLHYLYTDEVETTAETATQLMDVARSYEELYLIKLCERIVKRAFTLTMQLQYMQ